MSFDTYGADRAWSDATLAHARQIIRAVLGEDVNLADFETDTTLATDLITRDTHTRIAHRSRRGSYWHTNLQDLTIRCGRDNGAATEVEKLHHANLYLCQWVEHRKTIAWVLADIPRLLPLIPKARKRATREGQTFAAIPLSQLKKCGAIIAAGGLAAPYAQKVTTHDS